jgi:hypothetical protein
MPLDPRIALGFQSPQFESPMNMMSKLSEMSANAAQAKLAKAKLDAQMADDADLRGVNALAAAKGFDINNPQTFQTLNASPRGRALVSEYYAGMKGKTEFQKADEDLIKAELTGRLGALDALGSPTDPDAARKIVAWRAGTRGNQHLQNWMDSHGVVQPTDEEFAARIATPEGLAKEWKGARDALVQLTGRGTPKPEHLSTGETEGEMLVDTNPDSPTFGKPLAKFKSKPVGGGNTFNIGERSDLEAMKLGTKALYDTREKLSNAPEYWNSLEQARALIPEQKNKKGEKGKAFMGTGAEPVLEAIKFFNERFGTNINPGGVTATDQLRSLMFNGVLENLRKLDSQPSQQQQIVLQQSLGSIGTDPKALLRIIDWTQKQLENRVSRYNDEATQASGKINFLYDMGIKMPTRQSTTGGPPAPPEGYTPVAPGK